MAANILFHSVKCTVLMRLALELADIHANCNCNCVTTWCVELRACRCGANVCALIVSVSDTYLQSLSNGTTFTCSLDPGRNKTSYIYDFGHNIAGYTALSTALLPAGTTLRLKHAELMDNTTGMVFNRYCSDPCVCGGDGGNCANQVSQTTVPCTTNCA